MQTEKKFNFNFFVGHEWVSSAIIIPKFYSAARSCWGRVGEGGCWSTSDGGGGHMQLLKSIILWAKL